MRDPSSIWNFAYGSNMHPAKVRRRAGFRPRRVQPATLDGWRLAFNLATGIGWIEPSMANVVPAPDHTVHGLALEMSAAEFRALERSEGGQRFYRSVDVMVTTYEGESLAAKVFVAQHDAVRAETAPSLRYMTLIRAGARYHGLAAGYCDWLAAHPTASPHPLAWLVPLLFRILEHPAARPLRSVYLWLVKHIVQRQSKRHPHAFSM